MADEWDDEPAPTKPAANTKKFASDGWDDSPAPAKKSNQATNDGWDDEPPKQSNNGGFSKKKEDDGWDDEPSSAPVKSNGWSGGNDDSSRKPFNNRSNSDRPPRANDWICNECSARVFGSRSQCFKCQADKGDAKDAPPDSGRPQRAKDWICDSCGAKVFGSKDTCFKCQAEKGDSKDAPDDGGSSNSRGGRPSDWICDACGVKVFGSKSECFKCHADKGDSKDAPADGGGSSWNDDKKSDNGDKPRARAGERPGDWKCECGVSNFASREECFKCQAAKPEGAGGDVDPKFNSEGPKEFYIPAEVEADDLFGAGITSGINFSKFNDIPVKSTDTVRNSVPPPCKTFKDMGLNEFLLDIMKKCNYTTPTPIQQHGIPVISAGRDLMACAQTGSGKTAAFLIPMIQQLMAENAPCKIAQPYVVIVTPTRELCTQIYNEARKFSNGSIIKCCQIYGGTATRHQNTNLNNGCHILVATPGRLKDFCDKTYVTFENLRYFVLDEADRMLDMGFAPAVEEIMRNPTMVPTGKRQTLMFSATFPNEIQRLAGKYLHEYIFITIGVVGGASSDVTQNVIKASKFEKRPKLMEILKEEDPRGTMVFVETKRTADFLDSYLSESEHPTTSIHGDRKQQQREEALSDFKKGKMKVLIATSVAARGLDIPGVRHVVNYDIPKSIDDYVHRIGRTGRVGNVGKATSFFDPEQDSEIASDLVRVLTDSKQTVPDFLLSSGGGGGGGQSNDFGGTDCRSNQAPSPTQGGGDDDEEW